jgi:hypothetical protein
MRKVLKTRRLLPAGLLLLLAVTSGSCRAADGSAATVHEARLKTVLLPSHVTVFGLALTESRSGPSSEWSTAARAAMDGALQDIASQSPRFELVESPVLTAEERAVIDEVMAVALRVQLTIHNKTDTYRSKAQRAAIDRTLGPSLAFLERTGARYGIGVTALQLEQRPEAVALSTGLVAASLLTLNFMPMTGVTGSIAMLFLIDLQTGEIVWTNSRSGYEVVGINLTDLRDTASAQKAIGELLETFSGLAPAAIPTSPAAATDTRKTVSPVDGEFAFVPPEDWQATPDQRLVTATRNGPLLDEIRVELRRHGNAFPETRQESAGDASAERLAELYAAEIQSLGLDDLQISETTFEATLAGRPAFLMRFSFSSPLAAGGARIERTTVAAAVPRGLLIAQLTAPQLSYSGKARPAFEESLRTMQLVPRVLPR